MDNQITQRRRAVAADPTDGKKQAELNAALLRSNIERTCVDGRWFEHHLVFNDHGEVIKGTVTNILPVILRHATLNELQRASFFAGREAELNPDRVSIEQDVGAQEYLVVQFDGMLTTAEVLLWIDCSGYRLATVRDLFFVAEQHQVVVQSLQSLIALGTVISPEDLQPHFLDELLPVLDGDSFPWLHYELTGLVNPNNPGIWLYFYEDSGVWGEDPRDPKQAFLVRPSQSIRV